MTRPQLPVLPLLGINQPWQHWQLIIERFQKKTDPTVAMLATNQQGLFEKNNAFSNKVDGQN